MFASPIVLILLALLPADPPTDPTRPAPVTLDFRDRPVPEVVAAIAAQSGNPVVLQFWNEAEPNPRRVTLTSAEPVPFWEAIDRLCADLKIQRTLNEPNAFGSRAANVSLYGPGVDPGPALYAGPFRLGRFSLHSDARKFFVPPVRGLADARESDYRAEFEVLPEPRVLALRTGPLVKLEALDDRGRSLLPPAGTDPDRVSGPVGGYGLGAFQSLVRVHLNAPPSDARRLKVLRGAMPVEVALMPKAPAATIPLAESVGKTIRAGDLAVTIEAFGPQGAGAASLRVVAKIDGPRAPGDGVPKPLSWARSGLIARCLEVVDADGRPLPMGAGGSSAGDEFRATYTFSGPRGFGQPATTPKTLRVYVPEWVRWEAPFEFSDIPLP
jgi:hypothetical protein